MAFAKLYSRAKKVLKTRGLIVLTEILPIGTGRYGAKGALTAGAVGNNIATVLKCEQTRAKVPKEVYTKTAEFMRTDEYDEATGEVYAHSDVTVWQIPNGRVYTNQASQYFILDGDGQIVPGVSYRYQDAIAGKSEDDIAMNIRYFPKPEKIKGRAVSFIRGGGPATNIYHWLVDALPGLYHLDGIQSLDDIDVFLVQNAGYPDWIESLTLLGVPRSKIRIVNEQLIHIQADEMISMTPPRGRLSNVTPYWAVDFLKERYLPLIPPREKAWPEKIYISRKDSSLRGVLNEDELLDHLKPQGFFEVVLTQCSFAEKVGYFSNAKEVVAMSGAGFVFLSFCQPGARVIEMFPAGFTHYANCIISQLSKMRYEFLIFGEEDTGKSGYDAQRQELIVDIPRLQKVLDQD